MRVFPVVITSMMVLFACHGVRAEQGWFDAGLVTRIHSGDVGGHVYAFSTVAQYSVTSCGDNIHGYFVTDDASGSAKRIYATLLLAYSMNKNISIYLTGACPSGRPEVGAVEIKDVGYY